MANFLSIGQLATRTGVAVSALRYYESMGLISAVRNEGGQRRFLNGEIRRISFVMLAQRYGYSLSEIEGHLASLPKGRNPNKRDWTRLSKQFASRLDDRIAEMQRMRDTLDGCIGCGCLSLASCRLFNPDDIASSRGAGPRNVLD